MSGLEVVGIVASILQIADLGAKLSVKLCSFYRSVKAANQSLQGLSSDVSLTCSILNELGKALEKDDQARLCSQQAFGTAQEVLGECKAVFEKIESALEKYTRDVESNRLRRGARKITAVFAGPDLEALKGHLERLKTTTLLMLHVLMYAGQLRKREAKSALRDQRALIQALLQERAESDALFPSLPLIPPGVDDECNDPLRAASSEKQQQHHQQEKQQQQRLQQLQRQQQEKQLSSLPPELKEYYLLIRRVLGDIDACQHTLEQSRHLRIRNGIVNVHSAEASIFQHIHGHAAKQLFDDSFFYPKNPYSVHGEFGFRRRSRSEEIDYDFDYRSDDSTIVIRKESREHDAEYHHHRRHIAESDLVASSAETMLDDNRDERLGRDIGIGRLGQQSENAARIAREYYRSRSRSRRRRRSGSGSRPKTLEELGLGAASVAGAAATPRARSRSRERRSRSRTRSRSRYRARSPCRSRSRLRSRFEQSHLTESPPTAVPLQFRRPTSSDLRQSFHSARCSAPEPQVESPPQTRRRRPNYIEFKNSAETRPLWLAERHDTTKEDTQLEGEPLLPSLPSSKTSSANASVQDLTPGTELREKKSPEEGKYPRHARSRSRSRSRGPHSSDLYLDPARDEAGRAEHGDQGSPRSRSSPDSFHRPASSCFSGSSGNAVERSGTSPPDDGASAVVSDSDNDKPAASPGSHIIVDGDLVIDMGSPPSRPALKVNPEHFSSDTEEEGEEVLVRLPSPDGHEEHSGKEETKLDSSGTLEALVLQWTNLTRDELDG